jgi:hypothetical protein
VEIRLGESELQKKPNGDAAVSVVAIFHADYGGKEALVGGSLITEGESYDKPHPHEIMGHTGTEIKAVAGKIANLAYVNNIDKSGVKWLHLYRQGDF